MPHREAQWTGSAWKMLMGPARVGAPGSPYQDGIDVPTYEPRADLLGAKNIGNKPNTGFGYIPTEYTGAITNGIAQLQDGAIYQDILFNCVVDLRNSEKLRNCRVVVPITYTGADSIAACVRVLNGGTNTAPELTDCEIHNRAQRPMNGIAGRNTTIKRTVVTGCIDAFSTSASGSAPQNFGFDIQDCIQPETAWWYTPTVNPTIIHPSDTQSHNDGIQHGVAALRTVLFNTVITEFISEIIGTGTPGSGADAGNPYVPAAGYNFISTQAQMEAWRATYCNTWTDASQTMGGVSRRITTSGGSLAAVMINRDNIRLDKVYMDGGIVTVNMLDTNLPTNMNVEIENCVFWNAMKSGHGSDSKNKGTAVNVKSGKTLASYLNNKWFDGTDVPIVYS